MSALPLRRSLRFWLITAAAAVGVALALALGFWQLGRAHEKIALQQDIEQRRSLPAVDTSVLMGPDDAQQMHRAVELRGRWSAKHTVFLDNRQMHAKPGFYVVTPLLIEGTRDAVLVQRGWVQRNFVERDKLPPVETPDGVVTVRGRIAPPPARLYEFAGAGTGAIRQNLDLAALRLETGLALAPLSVVETGPASQGLLRDWPLPATGVEKHYGYAFQWWALAALIAILYAWFQFIAPADSPRLRDEPLGLTVHTLPEPGDAAAQDGRRTAAGRMKMFLVLAICAAPVVASYFTYYVIRPEGRRNHGELVEPQRPLPAFDATTLEGKPVPLPSLRGQWLLVSVAGGACDAACEKNLYLQRQLRESLGKEKDRVDWLWLVDDMAPVRPELQPALSQATVLRVDRAQLAQWLAPGAGHQLADHLYLVDPMGNWMMRFAPPPAQETDAATAKNIKRDLDRVLRASSSWDRAGR